MERNSRVACEFVRLRALIPDSVRILRSSQQKEQRSKQRRPRCSRLIRSLLSQLLHYEHIFIGYRSLLLFHFIYLLIESVNDLPNFKMSVRQQVSISNF